VAKSIGTCKKNPYIINQNHIAFLFKLLDKGIGGNFYKIIKHMYSNTKYSYKSSNFYSNPFMANSGVKQGDNLSPHSSISLLMTLQNI
jgi:hypothetical protein